MKKFIKIIILLLLVVFPNKVLAEGYISASPGSLTIEQGSAKTFTITAYNAIGDTIIKSENTSIATVNTNEWGTGMVGEKETKTTTITVTGKSVGKTNIIIEIDAATFDSEDLSGTTKTISINVVEKTKVEKPTPEPVAPTPQEPQVVLSTNNNLKSIDVEGYKLTKIDNNNYSLIVSNDVSKIKLNATAEDSKAKVEGIGLKELKVGENIFEVIIISESGTQNKISIKVTRKDGYYLEDLESLLKQQDLKDIDIIINTDTKISKENISKIKENKKSIRFNYYDENKKILYSWSIDGNKIRESEEFITTINYNKEKVEEIYELSNFADGLYVNFKHNGKLPSGTKIKLYVGDKFKNDDIVSVHRYNEQDNKLEFIKDNLNVSEGYIEFDIDHCSDYFVTMSNIGSVNGNDNDNVSSSSNILLIILIVAILIIIGLITFIVIKFKTIDKNNLVNEEESVHVNQIDNFANNEIMQETISNINDNLNVSNDNNLFNNNLNEIKNINNNIDNNNINDNNLS